MMTNLKEETLKTLKDCGKTIEDVLWVSNATFSISLIFDFS